MTSEKNGNIWSIPVNQQACEFARGLINYEDLSAVQKEQIAMLEHLDKINQMLTNCNDISEKEFANLFARFQQHTSVLNDMKKNLHYIHTHIRHLKSTLHEKYPELRNKSQGQNVAINENTSKSTVTSLAGLDSASDQRETE